VSRKREPRDIGDPSTIEKKRRESSKRERKKKHEDLLYHLLLAKKETSEGESSRKSATSVRCRRDFTAGRGRAIRQIFRKKRHFGFEGKRESARVIKADIQFPLKGRRIRELEMREDGNSAYRG